MAGVSAVGSEVHGGCRPRLPTAARGDSVQRCVTYKDRRGGQDWSACRAGIRRNAS
jgi:hypothetical protein